MITALFVTILLGSFIYGLLFMPDQSTDLEDFGLWGAMVVGSVGTALCVVYHVYKFALI